ncbi:MAG: AMP-binding protein [Micrococcales bacterium]|nr:AMP-binding protein [Micrococcales bacterium]
MTFPDASALETLDSVPRLLDDAVRRRGASTAFRIGGAGTSARVGGESRSVSYVELRRYVHAMVRLLDDMLAGDTSSGDTNLGGASPEAAQPQSVGIVGATSYPWVLSFLGLACSGRVAVPVDGQLAPATVAAMLDRAGARVVLVDDPTLAVSLAEVGIKTLDLGQVAAAAEASADGADRDLADLGRVSPDGLALKIFTSGTAGTAKLVHLSHDNIVSNAAGCADLVRSIGDDLVTIAVLPLHHLYGLNTSVMSALLVGATVCFGDGPHRFARDITAFSPNILVVVPMVVVALHRAIWREAERTGRAASLRRAIKVSNLLRKLGIDVRRRLFRSVHDSFGGRLRTIVSGGAYLSPEHITGFDDLGLEVLVGYGITECSPLVAANVPGAKRLGTVGKAATGVEVRIIDDEVCVRGRSVMVGYDRLEDTQAAFVDGWFRTGDKGSLDARGWLTITGRLKSLIILSDGNNVDPEEVEQVLQDHPFVDSLLVRGHHEPDREGIMALVYPSSEAEGLGPDEISARIDALVDEYNRTVPVFRRVFWTTVVDEPFERTSLGKVKRYLYAEGRAEGLSVS